MPSLVANLALRRRIPVLLEQAAQPTREEGLVGRGRILRRFGRVIGIERLDQRLRGLESLRREAGEGGEDEQGEDEEGAHRDP